MCPCIIALLVSLIAGRGGAVMAEAGLRSVFNYKAYY